MRLSKQQLLVIRKAFKKYFFDGDSLWLFGSRADDTKRGGDIDLYIETYVSDQSVVFNKKLEFLCEIKEILGDQKIDVVVNHLLCSPHKPVYVEARNSGILLMTKKSLLTSYITNLSIHARRLRENLEQVQPFMPISAHKLYELPMPQSSYLEVVNSRFCKMQDDLGSKMFPQILEIKGVEANTFIDKLNTLEKLGYLDDAAWFAKQRELRNEITHDYEDDYESLAKHNNQLIIEAQKLLEYWEVLKPKLEPLTTEQKLKSSKN